MLLMMLNLSRCLSIFFLIVDVESQYIIIYSSMYLMKSKSEVEMMSKWSLNEAKMMLILVSHASKESRSLCIHYLIEFNLNNILCLYVYGLCLLVCLIVPKNDILFIIVYFAINSFAIVWLFCMIFYHPFWFDPTICIRKFSDKQRYLVKSPEMTLGAVSLSVFNKIESL
jgi:hypothetical protein